MIMLIVNKIYIFVDFDRFHKDVDAKQKIRFERKDSIEDMNMNLNILSPIAFFVLH